MRSVILRLLLLIATFLVFSPCVQEPVRTHFDGASGEVGR
jgi:hypothetical protein